MPPITLKPFAFAVSAMSEAVISALRLPKQAAAMQGVSLPLRLVNRLSTSTVRPAIVEPIMMTRSVGSKSIFFMRDWYDVWSITSTSSDR